jgi:hypothetical protein
MGKKNTIALFVLAVAITAAAGSKIEGTTTLKDFQPTGTVEKKTHKNQQYDLIFRCHGQAVHLPFGRERVLESHRFRRGKRLAILDQWRQG